MFVLAHLTDPHIGPLPPAGPVALAGKRLLGFLSWHRRRKHLHRPEILARLLDDLGRQPHDHVALTGDLTNIALPAEFRAASAWLETLGSASEVSVIPGNHDAYVALPEAVSLAGWRAYMRGDDSDPGVAPEGPRDGFPWLRRRGPLDLIGLSSALPTAPTRATGTLGRAQLERLDGLLSRLADNGRCRCILIHHPPAEGVTSSRKRLTDAPAFRALLARHGADLVLHGHVHHFVQAAIDGPAGPIPVIGAASASGIDRDGYAASYHLYRFVEQGDRWRIEMTVRRLDGRTGNFTTARESVL
ncbi:metallophosphoesterase family protein [Oceanibacterium hippocampi]|uniref:Calcineurin-like phosphoesterase n=1 Tax=Oceanibacterium hippocampi TaxID=745714 RepID=A0A1Y5TXH8_9PROT|nr:metallophosphoesterase [Oceanibacterium hippocampi]SLN76210.1 Calcineurin-like phosphoesterase [Oceanibacterium hippocampi]